jgi:hypothetical protein
MVIGIEVVDMLGWMGGEKVFFIYQAKCQAFKTLK